MWGLSGSKRRIARVATLWLLSASLVCAHDRPTTLSQHRHLTSSTPAGEAPVSADGQHQVSTPPPHEKESVRLEVDIDDIPPPVAEQGAPSNDTFPSARCASREEWQGTCQLWSGKRHNRYLVFNRVDSREGIGANLARVAWVLRRAISFDLEPVIIGPLMAGHGTGNFGDWMGLTNNPLLMVQDPAAFQKATLQSVPFPEGNGDAWFLEQQNRTSVVYEPDPTKVDRLKDWGIPVSLPSSDARVCQYARQSLRNLYWSVPQNRGRCHDLLPDGHTVPPQAVGSRAPGDQNQDGRPWVVAVHVRRGDTITFKDGARSLPHTYFQATVYSVLRAIAATDPLARVSVLVFSQGPDTLTGLQLVDQHGEAVTWNIEQESCSDLGLTCSQRVYLNTTAFETFDCMATADVVVGSRSSFSDTSGAVSTNIKVLTRDHQTEQDRVTLKSEAMESSGAVSSEEQLQMDTAVSDWWHCSREARMLTGTTTERLAASQFYQTVDGGLPSR